MQQNGCGTNGAPERLINCEEVRSRTQLSKTEIYRRMNAGKFPANVKLGLRAVAWREADIDGWIRDLVQQSALNRGGR